MAAGTASEEQAVVIVKGVDALTVEHRRKVRDLSDRSGQTARSGIGARDGVSRRGRGEGAATYHGLLV